MLYFKTLFPHVGFFKLFFFFFKKESQDEKNTFYVNFQLSYSHVSVDAAPQMKIRVAWLHCRVYSLPIRVMYSAPMRTVCVYLYQPINSTFALNCLFFSPR